MSIGDLAWLINVLTLEEEGSIDPCTLRVVGDLDVCSAGGGVDGVVRGLVVDSGGWHYG